MTLSGDAKTTLRELILKAGFDVVGFARAEEAPCVDRFDQWLAQEHHAGMAWMARNSAKRRDPRQVLPDARTVMVVALNYNHPRPAPPDHPAGRVSCYAWGRDYHKVVGNRLRGLVGVLSNAYPAERWYWSVDTGPVLERAWAARAGVGWIGKHSLVLRRDLGSWFFLGALLTTLEVEPDAPAADHCGSCTRCIDACPTDAILPNRTVDSVRCISYQTIENREAIPDELAPRFGDWVFGCDICQQVCPWNRDAPPSNEPEFAPREGHAWLDLARVSVANDEDLRATFAGSPIRRPQPAGLRRNAKIALGNLTDGEAG